MPSTAIESTKGGEAMTPDTPSLHNQIMNLPCDPPADFFNRYDQSEAYKLGHRDARHAAAELANAADAELERLRGEVANLKQRLAGYAIYPEYDCPGDTPEICGYLCAECGAEAYSEAEIIHKAECVLFTAALSPEATHE